MKFALIAAVDKNFGIGKNNTLPWRLPSDLKHFSEVTTVVQDPGKANAVIMGRKTWDSLPPKSKPLKNRLNIVLSREASLGLPQGVLLSNSLDEGLALAQSIKKVENVFVIGGANLFAQAINHPDCQTVYLTQIEQAFDCDTFFPLEILQQNFKIAEQSRKLQENGLDFSYVAYARK